MFGGATGTLDMIEHLTVMGAVRDESYDKHLFIALWA
jgi:hypothetical protein